MKCQNRGNFYFNLLHSPYCFYYYYYYLGGGGEGKSSSKNHVVVGMLDIYALHY